MCRSFWPVTELLRSARGTIDASTLVAMHGGESLAVPPHPVFGVTVTKDELAAYLEVALADPELPAVDTVGALAYLAEIGVKFGIEPEHVDWALEERGIPVLVARGRLPVDGQDGRLQVRPSLLEIGGRPRVRDDGGVDLFDLNLIHNVHQGEVLGTRIPPGPGKPGMTVRGRVLASRAGRSAPGYAGRGTRLLDGGEITAAVTGHAVVVRDWISVSPIYQVQGDVGVATGHIAFVGSVVVRGDVRPGFRVKADGDVEVRGNVDGGVVEAGGNLSVRYGIVGQGRIVAAGAVRAKFIQYADIHAGAEVWVSDGLVQSNVVAGSLVEVLGRFGSIVGGHISAGHSVRARGLGSPGGIPTIIEVGVAPELKPEALRVRTDLTQVARKIQVLQARLKYLSDVATSGRLNQRGALEVKALVGQLQALIDERKQLAARQTEVERLLVELNGAYIDAQDVCHAEVRVVIGADVHLVRKAERGVRFCHPAHGSEVELVSLDEVSTPVTASAYLGTTKRPG